MEQLLVGAASFLLESVASLGIDNGVQSLSEQLSTRSLLKADEKVREYLMTHLPDYEYEAIDRFLAENGVYSQDQATTNYSIMSIHTARIIEDFYNTHPALKYEHSTLTPLLKQAIGIAYQSVIAQLGKDSRILYNQAVRNREQSHIEHQELSDQLNNIKYILANSVKKLPYSEVIKVYDVLTKCIYAGDLASADTLLNLMENQVDNRDRSYCTALRIFLYSFIGSNSEVDALCVQYLRENPSGDLTTAVATFLLQMDSISSLKIIQPAIQEDVLAAIVLDWVSETPQNAIKRISDDNHKLKKEYATTEYALWAYANHSRKIGAKVAALKAYTQIERIHPMVWVRWLIQELKSLMTLTASMVNINFDVTKIPQRLECLLTFSDFFVSLRKELCLEFVDVFLTCARTLPIDEFDGYYGRLNQRLKEWPQTKSYWYAAHLLGNDQIEETELRTFCESTNDDNLWSIYLYCRSTDTPEFVISYIEENKELLNKEFSAVLAYSEALFVVNGEEVAFDMITSLTPPKLRFSCNVYFAELSTNYVNGKEETYIQAAVEEAYNPSSEITIAHLCTLTNLLVSRNQWADASRILEKYQDSDFSLMLLRLKILISHEDQLAACCELIKKLDDVYENDAYILYCKGVIAEQELPGSGMELFESAFHLNRCPQYAHATLASRLNRKSYIEDDVLLYASTHSDVDLLYLSGVSYARHGKEQKSATAFLQALINYGDSYHEGLYGIYTSRQLGNNHHKTPPEIIEPGTCCVLITECSEAKRKFWIHNDDIIIPAHGSNFAGYDHISPNSQIAFSLLGLHTGDEISLAGTNYKVIAINYGDVIATKCCMQALLDHGVIRQISVDTENMDIFFEEVRKLGEDRSNHINNLLEKYRVFEPGITLELFANAIGKPYYKVVFALAQDPSIPFWAGSDGKNIDRNCIITPSVIAILASLGIHPPAQNDKCAKFYVTNALKVELELHSRECRNDRTAAVLGFEQDGHPYMVENTPESRHSFNIYFGCLNEWASWAHRLEPISPQDYPPDLKNVANVVGVPNIEAIVTAQKLNALVCCDDLFLRKYLYSIGIGAPTTIDVLIALGYQYEEVIGAVTNMLDWKYISPITMNFLCWVSDCFRRAQSDEELEGYSLPFIEVMKKILESVEHRTCFLHVFQQLIDKKFELHPTLKWIINISLLNYFGSASVSENES